MHQGLSCFMCCIKSVEWNGVKFCLWAWVHWVPGCSISIYAKNVPWSGQCNTWDVQPCSTRHSQTPWSTSDQDSRTPSPKGKSLYLSVWEAEKWEMKISINMDMIYLVKPCKAIEISSSFGNLARSLSCGPRAMEEQWPMLPTWKQKYRDEFKHRDGWDGRRDEFKPCTVRKSCRCDWPEVEGLDTSWQWGGILQHVWKLSTQTLCV